MLQIVIITPLIASSTMFVSMHMQLESCSRGRSDNWKHQYSPKVVADWWAGLCFFVELQVEDKLQHREAGTSGGRSNTAWRALILSFLLYKFPLGERNKWIMPNSLTV
jgi:hypothetical protein